MDIVTILENEGIELRKDFALCPFHIEKTPSFKVYRKENRYYCFGCGAHGDGIQFVMDYHKLSFKEALHFLNINDRSYKTNLKETKRKELLKQFRQWEREYCDDLCCLYRTLQKAKENAKTIEEVEALAEFYNQEPIWLYRIEILQSNDAEKKFELYEEWLNEERI
jgi:DNA primase